MNSKFIINLILISFTLFPINGVPLFVNVYNKLIYISSSIPSLISTNPLLAIFLIVSCWSMAIFLVWITSMLFVYWNRVDSELKRLDKSPLESLPSVSVVIPAYNESKTIIQTINACLQQTHKPSKIIIVDDGSTDNTWRELYLHFGLSEVRWHIKPLHDLPTKGKLKGAFISQDERILLLIQENTGKGYALNRGFNYVDTLFACLFDADTIAEPEGLAKLVSPMVEDPSVAITSGRNQFVTGCKVELGRVVNVTLTRNPLLIAQTAEFFHDLSIKAFRNSINAQTVLIGNFSCYRSDFVYKLNGFAERGVTEDYDYNLEVHRQRGKGEEVKIYSILTSCGWTQAPYTIGGFINQRTRWFSGVVESLIKQRDIIFDWKTGATGGITIPLHWYKIIIFPIYALINFIGIPIAIWLCMTDPQYKILGDILLNYYIPAYFLTYVVGTFIMSYLDWKYIKSYSNKNKYFYIGISKLILGYPYELLRTVCAFIGLSRVVTGKHVWGKMERKKV